MTGTPFISATPLTCLPVTGASPPPFLLALALLALGATALTIVGIRRRRGSSATMASLALLTVLAVGVGAGATPAPAYAADACAPAPTTSPSPTTAPTLPAVPAIADDVDVSFTSGGVQTFGSYRGPVDPTHAVAAAVIVVGTGAVDRNGDAPGVATRAYAWLADLLSVQGIASLRYDKLGTGATGLGPYASDPDAMLALGYDQLREQPARDALSFLAAQPGIDTSHLLLVGHSEGGGVALAVASDLRGAPAIAGLALVEPLYGRILDVVPRQIGSEMQSAEAAGAMTASDVDTLTRWMAEGVDEIRAGTPPYPDPGPVPLPDATDTAQYFQGSILANVYGTDPAQMVVSHAYRTRYGKEFDELVPADDAPLITVPTLVTCGTKDFNTPCVDGDSGTGVLDLGASFRLGVATVVQIPNMVHILRDVGDDDPVSLPEQLDYPFSTVFEHEFSSFVAQFTPSKP